MTLRRSEHARVLIAGERFLPFGSPRSAMSLCVPARPEALSIVRLVLMSRCAAEGIGLHEIFERSHKVADAFATALIAQPEATCVVFRTQNGADGVDVVPVLEDRSRA